MAGYCSVHPPELGVVEGCAACEAGPLRHPNVVGCPYCDALAGQECQTPGGFQLEPNQHGQRVHKQRLQEFQLKARVQTITGNNPATAQLKESNG